MNSSAIFPPKLRDNEVQPNRTDGGTPQAVLLIATLTIYQPVFWAKVGLKLQRLGCAVAFLCFDDRSYEHLTSKGPKSYTAFAGWLTRHGMANANLWFSHEHVTFEIRESQVLRRKFLRYAAATETVLAELNHGSRQLVFIQELDRFLPVIAAYHISRRREVDNYFIEPSLFRGHVFIQLLQGIARNLFGSYAASEMPGALTPARCNKVVDIDAANCWLQRFAACEGKTMHVQVSRARHTITDTCLASLELAIEA